MLGLWRFSVFIHNRIFDDVDESLCSRAWRYRLKSRFWAVWVAVFGTMHCQNSFKWHHFDKFQI